MAKMSNRKKESIAVNAIEKETFPESSYLVADIPVGDKAPSFDGQITVYKDDSERKESYINDVPTQVKGTGVKKFTVGKRKFPLNLSHYQNYYKRGGCLLLVVEILENTDTKIFYKQLLPLELKQIISKWGHQKSVSVELRPLEGTTLYYVCRKFIDQMIKQPQILIEKNQYKDEDYEEMILTSMTFNPETEEINDIFNHDFFQFGIKDNIEYPLRNTRIGSIALESKEKIEINNNVFNDVLVKTEYAPPKTTKLIEGCLELIIDQDTNKLNFTIKEIKSLSAQLKILPLLIEFMKSGEFIFSDFYAKISFEEASQYIKDFETTHSLFLKLQKLFLELKVNENIEFGHRDNVIRDIERLIDIMVNHDYSGLKVKNPNNPSFFRHQVGDIYILLFYNPKSDIKIINAFSQELLDMKTSMVIKDTMVEIPISPYLLLEKDTLIHAKNLDIDFILKSFEAMSFERYEQVFNTINNFCLICLNTFDVTKNIDILRLPYYLLNKLLDIIDIISNPNEKRITIINLLQTKIRQNNKLTKEEYKELINLKDSLATSVYNLELNFCISVLLQSKNEAHILFEEFDPEKKEFHKKLPIFSLYQNL